MANEYLQESWSKTFLDSFQSKLHRLRTRNERHIPSETNIALSTSADKYNY